ncbi:membrane protein [Rhodococcoides trifolii]|uniref:Membrane protein n=1 Tax=Rhodococcoides trifolii TaxID=908250 RepID=A0A917FPH7_9NOCA|nr:MMPL family transporter [Rhodococcus trifolii]GGF92798.1 membrane protein [Rhodococcus trifolii]
MPDTSRWDGVAALVTRRRSWAVALAVLVFSAALMGFVGSNDSAGQSPTSLPPSSESAAVQSLLQQFPDSDTAPVILVVTRGDGAELTPTDLADAENAAARMASTVGAAAPPAVPSPDGQAAIAPVQIDSSLSGFDLNDAVSSLRSAATDGLPTDLTAQVTGGPAFGADIANSFAGADFRLLAVTAAVVALLLIVTYRSPILWLVPLLVVGIADRVASTVGTAVADLTGLTFDGSTSGITSVLVFGAGTNYALLLISRYREELMRESNHRLALTHAVRQSGPAILASNVTVVLALLSLVLGILPSTRSLGALAAAGLIVAAIFVLFVLPPALALCGRKVFWPFVPEVSKTSGTGHEHTGVWYRIASAVARTPGRVAAISVVVLAVCAVGVLGTGIGLSQTDQFRVSADSVDGFDTLAQHFPAGSSDPTTVVARTSEADAVVRAIDGTPGVDSSTDVAQSDSGLTRWSVVLTSDPASEAAFDTVASLRAAVHDVAGAQALVGGSDAQAYDISTAASRDRLLLIPIVLVIVLVVLLVLLRAVVAPLILVAATVLSALAALGVGSWVSEHLFGFPALDDNVPLFAFLFLVALGVDYTIFLITRAREETPEHGTRAGIVRAVGATGGVITSAGVVLAAVFCVLGVLPLITLTQLGIIVCIGILLDTFVVRTVVIPALFTLIGPRVWWPSARATAEKINQGDPNVFAS